MADIDTSEELNGLKRQLAALQARNTALQQQNEELEAFAYIASHDLQEPLRKVHIFSERILASDGERLSEKGRDSFGRIQNAIGRMQQLIDSLLRYSRTGTDEKLFTRQKLGVLVQDALKQHRERIAEKQALVEVGELPTLSIIPQQFIQLIENLLCNALKYSREGVPPHIRISASVAILPGDTAVPDTVPGGTYWKIDISDNGIGFDLRYREKIFELFQRLHGKHEYEGSGVGLAICKRIAQNHHGFIAADSVPGAGSCFSVFLPATQ